MKFADRLEEVFTSYLEKLGVAWWAEIVTARPKCIYYFGPFMSAKEAELACPGYIEDLEQEAAVGITVQIKRCQPTELTISGDEF